MDREGLEWLDSFTLARRVWIEAKRRAVMAPPPAPMSPLSATPVAPSTPRGLQEADHARAFQAAARAYRRRQLHVVLDNYVTHKHAKVQAWLVRHPRVQLHFTPTYASWLNLVEGFFASNYSGVCGSRTSGGQRSSPVVKRPTGWSSWTMTFCPAHPLTVPAWPCR